MLENKKRLNKYFNNSTKSLFENKKNSKIN